MPRQTFALAITLGALLAAAAPVTPHAEPSGGAAMPTVVPAHSAAEVVRNHRPDGTTEIFRRAVTVDGVPAEWVRYARADGRNDHLGGEHFSTVIMADGRLQGFTRMDRSLVGKPLPSKEDSLAIALDFLAGAAPDLMPGLEIHWIKPHDEPLVVTRDGVSETLTLKGMKVKMRNTADGRWMWVIVGPDRTVMVFERDIVWGTMPGHRPTEKWLHDIWLADQGHRVTPATSVTAGG